MTDILAAIDAAIGCQQCSGPLGDSPSMDFCGPVCQARWHQQRTNQPEWADRPEEHGARAGCRLPSTPPTVHPGGEAAAADVIEIETDVDYPDDHTIAEVWNKLYEKLSDLADQHSLTLIRVSGYDQQIVPQGIKLAMSALLAPPRPELPEGGPFGADDYAAYVRAEAAWERQFGDADRERRQARYRNLPGIIALREAALRVADSHQLGPRCSSGGCDEPAEYEVPVPTDPEEFLRSPPPLDQPRRRQVCRGHYDPRLEG